MIITTYRMLFFFFFNDTATTEIYTLSLHDALPISMSSTEQEARQAQQPVTWLLVLSFVSMFAMLNDPGSPFAVERSEEHTSELQSRLHLVCRLLLEKKRRKKKRDLLDEIRHEHGVPRG